MEKFYKFCVIENSDVRLGNNEFKFNPFFCKTLENVHVHIDDKGLLHLKGLNVKYDWYSHKTYEDKWRDIPDSNFIFEGKKWLWSINKSKYVENGFVRKANNKEIDIIMTNYNINIY